MPTVLALCAHPDDAEFRCGGTLALLARAGWSVHIATLCAGDCGSAELGPNAIATIRRREAEAAAALLGGTYHWLGGLDLQVFDDAAMRGAAVAVLRTVRPDAVITHYPVDYMPDHEVASTVTRMATFTAGMPNYVVGAGASLPPTAGVPVLYYFGPLGGVDYFGNSVHPHFSIDVTGVQDDKAALLACHASQRDWLRAHHGIDQYILQMQEWDAEAGHLAGVPYAEGFWCHKGHGYPQTPLIQEALAGYVR
jgi:LmbE family N-acetylglucosaminyl deacetylase